MNGAQYTLTSSLEDLAVGTVPARKKNLELLYQGKTMSLVS